ncbi:O-antigen ligase family protein [Brevundimonas bacteroides]|uniref:O-antigen ligase family protein n=1 Tax=Brevundimonas bacteroides TaxID=74311 RepID=UPI0004973E99|nr:O-antigen ligase family protein [Brevundimonas bacteroides]
MTAEVIDHPRRKRSTAFGASSKAERRQPLRWRLGLLVLPTLFCLAHLSFGVNQPAAALWFSAILGLSLVVALASPLRRGLHDVGPVWELAILFFAVLGAAVWSLTPYTPGGVHPLYTWAGIEGGAASIDTGATVVEIVKLLGLAAVFTVGTLHGLQRGRAQATLEAIVWTGGAYAAVSLVTFLAGVQIAEGARLSGGLLSANNGATVFGILAVLSLSVFLRAWSRTEGLGVSKRLTKTAVPLSCMALCTVCLILTASRMGLVATVVALMALLLWETASSRKGRVPIWLGAGLLIGVGTVLTLSGNDLLWIRVGGIDADILLRGQIFAAHWQAFLASPLFGYGLGSFDAINTQIMTGETIGSLWSIRATHNVYLQWLEEAGLVGALPMFLLIAVVLVFSLARALGGKGRGLQRGVVCASLVVLVHGLTDYALQVPSIAGFWTFLLGLGFAFGQGRG